MDDSNGTSSTTPPTTSSSIAPTLSSTQQIFNSNVPLPPRLELRGNLAKNWKNWLQTWKAYETITSLHLKPQDYRVATFITCIGPEALEIHSGLPFASEAEKGRIDKVLELWNNYCVGKTNTIYERYKFHNRSQEPCETIDAYATAVRTLADTCSFGNLKEEMIRDRLVCGISDNGLRKKLLQESQLTLEKCMDYCRAAEAANSQLKEISSHGPDTVNYLSKPKKGKPQSQLQFRAQPKLGRNIASSANKEMIMRDCKYCGWRHERKKEECPAFGKTCHSCGGKDHFSNVCQQQIQPGNKASSRSNLLQSKLRVHELHEDAPTSSEDELWALSFAEEVQSVSDTKKRIYAAMEIGKKTVEMQIDTGESCNVLPRSCTPNDTELQTTKRELITYSKFKLRMLGTARVHIRNPCNNTEYAAEFVVVEDGFAPLLGAKTAQKMKLLVVQHQNIL